MGVILRLRLDLAIKDQRIVQGLFCRHLLLVHHDFCQAFDPLQDCVGLFVFQVVIVGDRFICVQILVVDIRRSLAIAPQTLGDFVLHLGVLFL